jgi:hypothetical protein
MKHLTSYKIFESRFLEFREVISTIKDKQGTGVFPSNM